LGWLGKGTAFDLLPIVYQFQGQQPEFFEIPSYRHPEVHLVHPQFPWFADLGLRWHALPVISDMVLEIGGIRYPAAPFNGWYMVTEIGSRNLGDKNRYNILPIIAEKMGLHVTSRDGFWIDRAVLELNVAVKHSFEEAGVSISDHHESSAGFMRFIQQEKKLGREVMADWAWIVPPAAASSLDVFHNTYRNEILRPNFFYNVSAWNPEIPPKAGKCPFHMLFRKKNEEYTRGRIPQ